MVSSQLSLLRICNTITDIAISDVCFVRSAIDIDMAFCHH